MDSPKTGSGCTVALALGLFVSVLETESMNRHLATN